VAVAVPLAGRAYAGPAVLGDHLRCVKVKDKNIDKAKYTADLVSVHPSFPNETGCQIKVPSKLFCFPTDKLNPQPTPPGAEPGAFIGEQLVCYKLKCPKEAFDVPIRDQFGIRTVSVAAPKFLCAPTNFD
jgi:hypothetical protein